jgi:hypothetical protein
MKTKKENTEKEEQPKIVNLFEDMSGPHKHDEGTYEKQLKVQEEASKAQNDSNC